MPHLFGAAARGRGHAAEQADRGTRGTHCHAEHFLAELLIHHASFRQQKKVISILEPSREMSQPLKLSLGMHATADLYIDYLDLMLSIP